jgi:hypothetical protein
MAGPLAILAEAPLSPVQVRAELEAILTSRTFERSERLRRFLHYVCDLTLHGESARINEYLVGSEVFGRGPGYSPNEDSVVRRQAHALRQKLQEYYAGEGAQSLVRLELPVGKYVPVFRQYTAPPAPVPPPSPAPRTAPRVAALALLLAALVFLAGWLVGRRAPAAEAVPQKLNAAAKQLWGPWISDPAGAVICFSSPLTTVVKYFSKKVPTDAQPRRLRADPQLDAELRRTFNLGPGGHLYLTPSTAQGKMGEAIAGVHLAGFLSRAGLPIRTTQSRFLSWETFRRENLVLLGHNEANRWLDPLLEKQPFRLAATEGESPRRILNVRPAAGEPPKYHIEFSDDQNEATQEYALVSMLPGVDGRRRLLLINGLNTQATQMAAEYVTNPSTLEDLLGRLQAASPNHQGPWHFQIVLRTEVRDKVPTRASLVAVRVL